MSRPASREGARTSLLIGIAAALSAVLVGALVGGVAGYYRRSADVVLMRLTEFFQTIPSFLFAIAAGGDPLAVDRSA